MYVNESTDKCDVCKKEFHPGDGFYGAEGPGAVFVGKDLCAACAKEEKLTNCAVCGGLHPEGTQLTEENEYTCWGCRQNRK